KDPDSDGWHYSILIGSTGVVLSTQFQPRDIAQVNQLSIIATFQNDLGKLFRSYQTALGVENKLKFRLRPCRLGSDASGGQLERFVPEPRSRRHPQLARGKTSDPDLTRPACCRAARPKPGHF